MRHFSREITFPLPRLISSFMIRVSLQSYSTSPSLLNLFSSESHFSFVGVLHGHNYIALANVYASNHVFHKFPCARARTCTFHIHRSTDRFVRSSHRCTFLSCNSGTNARDWYTETSHVFMKVMHECNSVYECNLQRRGLCRVLCISIDPALFPAPD